MRRKLGALHLQVLVARFQCMQSVVKKINLYIFCLHGGKSTFLAHKKSL